MKGLDTPALLALLHGEGATKSILRSWAGEELATTELNLLELTAIALSGSPKGRSARLEALGRLRRRLTVLPVDSKAQASLAARGAPSRSAADLLLITTYATLEGAGCAEVLTGAKSSTPPGHWKLKVRRLSNKHTK
ncbi:MAG: PIN domain-containing protein [Thermoplasmata archaeon]